MVSRLSLALGALVSAALAAEVRAAESKGSSADAGLYFLLTIVDLPDGGTEDAGDAGSGRLDGGARRGARDAGTDGGRDAGSEPGADGGAVGAVADAGPLDPCAEQVARLERRRAWLLERRLEQFARGGAPNPELGIPNMIGVWCEDHPGHEECVLTPVTLEMTTEELAWRPDSTPEDRDSHVILMTRAVAQCRSAASGRAWWSP